ncbi:uncharacterized protein LOC101735305 [Bombyx mori]|uniref:Cuticle protein n=1 Tax=Bombyx mori TaxID=7091 RepID=A0A8R1WEH6_BOMMO|nr:uncharacterized protein LOC101735305 [Bombyx mori]
MYVEVTHYTRRSQAGTVAGASCTTYFNINWRARVSCTVINTNSTTPVDMCHKIIFVLAATVAMSLANPLPEPEPFGHGKVTHFRIHVPYEVHTLHHHHTHVQKVPIIKEVPVIKELPIIREVPVVKTLPIVHPVPVPIVNTVHVEKPVFLPIHEHLSYSHWH